MECTIIYSGTIIDALKALNANNRFRTLFVVNSKNQLLGSLTDGDIRRYLINGGKLDDCVDKAMCHDCAKVYTYDANALYVMRSYKADGVKAIPTINKEGIITGIFDLVSYKSHLPIDAVLMAGGKGERLRPLTEKTPKPLVKVGEKCIIDYNIDRLIDYGVKHINVTVNYLKEQLHEHFATPRNGIKVATVEEPKFLGTIGSIQFIKEFHNDTILVMNSDLFTNIDFEDFYLHFKENDAMMSVAAIPYNVSIPFGILDLEGRNIKGLLEKPKYNYFANGGIYLIKREALEFIPKDEFFNATDLIESLISQGERVIRYPLNGTWIDIGQHADLEKARTLVKHLK